MRLEILIASPPTRKCKTILDMMQAQVIKYPEKLRLDIYYAGSQPFTVPTAGYMNQGKQKRVPSVFVNGSMVSCGDVPDEENLQTAVEEELSKHASSWAE